MRLLPATDPWGPLHEFGFKKIANRVLIDDPVHAGQLPTGGLLAHNQPRLPHGQSEPGGNARVDDTPGQRSRARHELQEVGREVAARGVATDVDATARITAGRRDRVQLCDRAIIDNCRTRRLRTRRIGRPRPPAAATDAYVLVGLPNLGIEIDLLRCRERCVDSLWSSEKVTRIRSIKPCAG